MNSHEYPDATFANHDPAFEPQATYGFAEPHPDDLSAISADYSPLDTFEDVGVDFGSMMSGPREFPSAAVESSRLTNYTGSASQVSISPASLGDILSRSTTAFTMPNIAASTKMYGSHTWAENPQALPLGTTHSMSGHLPPSTQTNIIQRRGNSVTQHFGQVTPPDESESPQASSRKSSRASNASQSAKLNKFEPARNAANTRHGRKPQHEREENGLSGSDEELEDKRDKYREKNRLAAAKCRQKKKTKTDNLEEQHRDLSAQNKHLRRVERQAREELTVLRDMALKHNADSPGCNCTSLHRFNNQRVEQILMQKSGFDWTSFPTSPSEEFMSNLPSPDTPDLIAFGGSGSFLGMPGVPMVSRSQSFGNPINFSPVTSADSIRQPQTAAVPAQDLQDFSGFLKSSPCGGRAGFGT